MHIQTKNPPQSDLRAEKPHLLSQAEAHTRHTHIAQEDGLLSRRIAKKMAGRTIREIAGFALTTIIIFVFIFSALNFSAYKKQLLFWWENSQIEAGELQSSINDASSKNRPSTLQPVAADQHLPTLNLDIAPPRKRIARIKADFKPTAPSNPKETATNNLKNIVDENPIVSKLPKKKEVSMQTLTDQASNMITTASKNIEAAENAKMAEKAKSIAEVKASASLLSGSVLAAEPIVFEKLKQFFTPKPKPKPLIASYHPVTKVIKTIPKLSAMILPPENHLIIPRLSIYAPIREVTDIDIQMDEWEKMEDQIQETLKEGIVHFPGTANPGEQGNAFLTGHSSYYPWDSGRYKDIFALLPQIELGDEIEVYQDQQKFVYRVSEVFEVAPDQIDVLTSTTDHRLTLMTCTPIGTTLKRLIVIAQLVE